MKKLCLQLFDLMYAEQSKAGKISNLNYYFFEIICQAKWICRWCENLLNNHTSEEDREELQKDF